MKNSFSIKAYPYEGTIKGNMLQVYIRLLVNRRKSEINTGILIHPNYWDKAAEGHKRKTHKINEDIAEIKAKLIDIKRRLEYEGKPVSAKIIKDIYTGKEKMDVFIIDYFDRHLKQMKRAGEHSKETISTYRQTRDKVADFIREIKKEKDYAIMHINYKFLNELDHYLITCPLERNTVNKHHSRFRTILLRAHREEYIKKKPYDDFSLKYVKKQKAKLEIEEVIKIMNHKLGGYLGLQKARDIFIFSVFTGIRYRAAQALNANQVKFDEAGSPYLEFNPGKNQMGEEKIETIPLLDPAYEIYKKYDNEERKITGKLLPRMANGTINKHLKVIAELTGIDKRLHHHLSRHTCATTILFENDVDIKSISQWLAHSGIKMTEHYTHSSMKKLKAIAENVNEHFEKIK